MCIPTDELERAKQKFFKFNHGPPEGGRQMMTYPEMIAEFVKQIRAGNMDWFLACMAIWVLCIVWVFVRHHRETRGKS